MRIDEAVALAPHTTLGVGGRARYFTRASSEDDVRESLAWAARRGLTVKVLGGGSNVVIDDAGIDGLVVAMDLRGVAIEERAGDALVSAAAGEPWDGFVASTVERGLQGLECLSGIPGLVGATPIQNVGAYGQDVAETIAEVRTIERSTLKIRAFSGPECHFGYRDSRFKSEAPDEFVVTAVRYRLRRSAPPKVGYAELERALAERGLAEPTVSDVRTSVLAVRRAKSMVLAADDENARSCGSFFTNPVVADAALETLEARAGDPRMPRYPQGDGTTKLSAAWLIEKAGFVKGTRRGHVGLSTRHALAVVCHGAARAADVADFAAEVRDGVFEKFGVRLEPEPVFWGFSGERALD